MYIPSVNLHNIAIEHDTFIGDVSDYLPTQNGDFPGKMPRDIKKPGDTSANWDNEDAGNDGSR